MRHQSIDLHSVGGKPPLNEDHASGGCHGFFRGAFRASSKKSGRNFAEAKLIYKKIGGKSEWQRKGKHLLRKKRKKQRIQTDVKNIQKN